MSKILKTIISAGFFLLVALILYFFLGNGPTQKNITWGVVFSQKHAENLKLDWKKAYLAIISDLGVKNIKLSVAWDWVEGEKDKYFFNDLDWQVQQAERNNVNLILEIGMKTSRWPECHIPAWAKDFSQAEREAAVLGYLGTMVNRYKSSQAVIAWQVENEPLIIFNFGECKGMESGSDFLKKEIALVKSIDPQRPIIVSDSGEFSLWLRAAKLADIVGATMYRKVWVAAFHFYLSEPFPPLYYYWRAKLVNWLFDKKVQCVELQAEPWGPKLIYDLSLEEQGRSMNLEQFYKNIAFAKETGLDTFYLWGAEWWYWMKEEQNQPNIWNGAKMIFRP